MKQKRCRKMKVLPRSFYARNTVTVAKDLLGKTLVRKLGGKTMAGIVTETEAYRYTDDPASHAFRGSTNRNKVMFGHVGIAYVYFTYGMHYCVNAVARSDSYDAGAVLIRSITPKIGINEMMKNRKIDLLTNLTNGSLANTEFLQRESFYYTDIKQTEDATDYTGFNVQGIGEIASFITTVITFGNAIPQRVSVGDMLRQDNGGLEDIGVITVVSGMDVTVSAIINAPVNGMFSFAVKNSRVEGSDMRGYYLEAKLSSQLNTAVELNGVTVNTVLSHN